jgi:hypothetical protein
MRIVNILSGLAVLFTTFAFGHLLHHYLVNAGDAAHSPPFFKTHFYREESPDRRSSSRIRLRWEFGP